MKSESSIFLDQGVQNFSGFSLADPVHLIFAVRRLVELREECLHAVNLIVLCVVLVNRVRVEDVRRARSLLGVLVNAKAVHSQFRFILA